MTLRRALVVEADGGSRGNPGVAGYGALVRDARTGTVLAERAAPLGTASNNVAEYTGLIEGLRAVLDLDLAREATVEIRMDSKLVVEQMTGRWKIKHADMRRLALEARQLVDAVQRQDGTVSFTWIPRERNGAADALSNDGMDGLTIRRDHVPHADRAAQQADEESGGRAGGRPVEGAGKDGGGRGGEAAAPWSLFDEPDGERPTAGGGTAYQERQGVRPTAGETRAPVADLVLSDETVPVLEGQTRLVLVRHGVTDYTQEHRVDGRGGSDPSLNSTGMAQARAAAQAVRRLVERSEPGPVSVVSSSLQRARQTGQAIADALGVGREEDRDWDEQGFGDWDGRTMGQLAEEFGEELRALRSDADYKRPGGESRRELDERVGEALARAVRRGGTVVVATHRVALMSVLCRLLGIDHERGWSLATAPASLSAVEIWPDGVAQVAFVNDTHHLYDPVPARGQDASVTIVDSSLD